MRGVPAATASPAPRALTSPSATSGATLSRGSSYATSGEGTGGVDTTRVRGRYVSWVRRAGHATPGRPAHPADGRYQR